MVDVSHFIAIYYGTNDLSAPVIKLVVRFYTAVAVRHNITDRDGDDEK